ncbi:MAG: MotA/TolQ/ExbB proton channel family protein [Desulfurivibrionaceae bacterium]|nr:MotA/TolQ/ExbB proton channel family protein [Desulfurivibrionaceae bacterium]
MTLWHLFQSGGPLMWPLLLCSLVVMTLVFERTLFWLKLGQKRNHPLVEEVLRLAGQGDWPAIEEKTKESRDFVVLVLVAALGHRHSVMTRAMEAQAEVSLHRMRRFMSALDTMITVAPLLGILGTVLGIIVSFEMLGAGGGSDPRAVTAGIAQALVTTALGLAIAVMAVVPYNFFNSRIRRAGHLMEKYGSRLEMVCQKKKAGAGRDMP